MYDFLNKIVLILQNVAIPPNCIIPTHSSSKCRSTFILYTIGAFINKMFQYLQLYTTDTLLQLFNKHWIYFFFLIFWHASIRLFIRMPRYRHWFFTNNFFKWFSFFKFNMPSQKPDKNNSIRIFFFIITIIRVNIIKIYIRPISLQENSTFLEFLLK